MKQENVKELPQTAKALSARLMAVQALYQSTQNDQALKNVSGEFLSMRVGMEVNGEKIMDPDGALFQRILEAVEARGAELSLIITENVTNKNKDIDLLLKSILMCASAELLVNREIDTPILINDYLNVAHAFYESGETRLLNGILDAVAKSIRN